MTCLSGEIALVTGASRGIGAGILLELGQRGAFVIGTATTEAGCESITESLQQADLEGRALPLRVESSESVAALFQSLESAPSVLVNNAGITRDTLLARMKDDDWEAGIDTNLSSVFRMCKAVLRGMMRARKGRIINLTSVVGLSGNAGQANYAAAKAGIVGFTKSLAREVAPRGITVNAVAPGFVDTDMTRALDEGQRETLLQSVPLRRLGAVEDIAHAVAFLASAHAGYITGETLNVNGGMLMP